MKTKSKTLQFLAVAGIALVVFLATSWVNAFSLAASTWGQAVCFFALTWYLAARLEGRLSAVAVVLAVTLGRVLPEVPVRIVDFPGTYYSFIILFVCFCAIILGALCQRQRCTAVYALTIVLMLLLNTVALRVWDNAYCDRTGRVAVATTPQDRP